ncbi:MAG: hypothetical protein JJLCMIEE_02327 [Acidimicrobiales bacterium]|nr:MAG: methyltransferase domain-containing protein [Actinomycetota bacterium]MBV6509258.1 hypothetical protein [Acidimicrobiales bacterium]RIK04013.1 MAG: SAM-dependent methyltransferase [Acidobacteriota bacterium]
MTVQTTPGRDVTGDVSHLLCRSCGGSAGSVFYERSQVPVHNSLVCRSRQDATAVPRGDLRLSVCTACGFVQNSAFDPSLVEYADDYEDTQANSQQFLAFVEDVAHHLDEIYNLAGRQVVEIGCGSGDFLSLLCGRTLARGTGYDPALRAGAITPDDRVRFVRSAYPPASGHPPAELIVCRHTLEHVPDVAGFVEMVAEANAPVFFEVPDTGRILDEGAFWDVYYEHCSYFTASSLQDLFTRKGFSVTGLRSGYDDQYLLLDATSGGSATRRRSGEAIANSEAADAAARCGEFTEKVRARIDSWNEYLEGVVDRGEKAVLWGGGSKAVSFLASVDHPEAIDCVVDINPAKWDAFLPGTGHRIVAPSELDDLPPSTVILMNPVYTQEITEDLHKRGLSPTVLGL